MSSVKSSPWIQGVDSFSLPQKDQYVGNRVCLILNGSKGAESLGCLDKSSPGFRSCRLSFVYYKLNANDRVIIVHPGLSRGCDYHHHHNRNHRGISRLFSFVLLEYCPGEMRGCARRPLK